MNITLIIGACLSAIASLLHIAIIIGAAPWYRFFGAGEKMALAADAGKIYPALITTGIALVLAIWAAYALSGAGIAIAGLARLPFLKYALICITAIYLLRGLAIIPLFVFAQNQVTPFLVWSSVICIGYGAVHLIGVYQIWETL